MILLAAPLLRNWTELNRFFWRSSDIEVAVCYTVIASTVHAVAKAQSDPQGFSIAHTDEARKDDCFVVYSAMKYKFRLHSNKSKARLPGSRPETE